MQRDSTCYAVIASSQRRYQSPTHTPSSPFLASVVFWKAFVHVATPSGSLIGFECIYLHLLVGKQKIVGLTWQYIRMSTHVNMFCTNLCTSPINGINGNSCIGCIDLKDQAKRTHGKMMAFRLQKIVMDKHLTCIQNSILSSNSMIQCHRFMGISSRKHCNLT